MIKNILHSQATSNWSSSTLDPEEYLKSSLPLEESINFSKCNVEKLIISPKNISSKNGNHKKSTNSVNLSSQATKNGSSSTLHSDEFLKSSIYTEYFNLTKEYQTKYGKNTVILMQVGAFFEIYGLLRDSSEQSVEKDQFAVACEGKNDFLEMKCSKIRESSDIPLQTTEKCNVENLYESIYTTDSEIYNVSNICQLNIAEKKYTFKNKKLVMAGFRDHTLEKYLQKITENNYSVVVYVQEKNEKNTRRVFHSVHSAGTYVSYDIENSGLFTNNVMCIWFDIYRSVKKEKIRGSQKQSIHNFSPQTTENGSSSTLRSDESINYSINQKGKTLICGISVVNTNTGKSFLFEYQTSFLMNPTTFDELERNISVYRPSEIIIISPFETNDLNKIIQYSGIQTNVIHKFSSIEPEKCKKTNENVEKCSQQKYINYILSSFYGEDAYQVCSEFNTNIIATQSFCFLLNFIKEHNPSLVKNIKLPEFNNTTDRMILANHTLKQLNIINDGENTTGYTGKLSSLLTFLNNCCSPMGKRMFQKQLLNPTFNEIWLEQEYKTTELFLDKYLDLLNPLRKFLSQIKDIEKIGRQFVIQKIFPSSIYHLYNSIINVQNIIILLNNREQILSSPTTSIFIHLMNYTEKSVEENQFAVACEGKLTFSPKQSVGKNEFCGNEVEAKLINKVILENISKVLLFIENNLVIENCKDIHSVNTFDMNIIREGVSPVLDLYYKKQKDNINIILAIKDYLNNLLNNYLAETNDITASQKEGIHLPSRDTTTGSSTPLRTEESLNYIKLHETEKMGFSFQITKKRGILLKKCLSKLSSSSHSDESINLHFSSQATANEYFSTEEQTKNIKIFIKDIKFSNATTSNDEIEIPIINKICRELQTLKDKINKEIQTTFNKFISDFCVSGNFSTLKIPQQSTENGVSSTLRSEESIKPLKIIEDIAEFTATIDVIQNKAYIANKYNYCRPKISLSPKFTENGFSSYTLQSDDLPLQDTENLIFSPEQSVGECNSSTLRPEKSFKSLTTQISFVNAIGLRHPLIEHIQQNELYVPNNLSLGFNVFSEEITETKLKNSTERIVEEDPFSVACEGKCKGILLYGINTSGKTSLIRALGISVIMAQAGLFVPCKEFTYKPYTGIYSRILGNDNLFKGLSTFAVEMSELRTILKSADNRSLVVGDELCSGTEIQSATSIFIAGLMELYKKNCSFIFATHLHEIVNYEEILKMEYLKIKHLSIHYDASLECIVYDRILKDGSGSSNYGLTVCKSLYMPEDFMKTAYSIRAKYFPETSGELSHKPTKYNSKKIKGKCEICNINIADEIHHLREQNESNEKGFIDGFHKNHPANLSALCEKCHLEMHKKSSNEKRVRKKTINGYVLI